MYGDFWAWPAGEEHGLYGVFTQAWGFVLLSDPHAVDGNHPFPQRPGSQVAPRRRTSTGAESSLHWLSRTLKALDSGTKRSPLLVRHGAGSRQTNPGFPLAAPEGGLGFPADRTASAPNPLMYGHLKNPERTEYG